MYRVFLSHSSRDDAAAQALLQWLSDAEPSLKGEVFLDVSLDTGLVPGVRWKPELARAVDRCEAVICLISPHWEASAECVTEARLAETLNKRVFCARIDPAAQGHQLREWQICDLFPSGQDEVIAIEGDNGDRVAFSADGLARLLRGLRQCGIGAEYFSWPPEDDQPRAPYRGWQSMEDADAAVFFGRDPQILRGVDTLRGMRATGIERMFVILGQSGVGKSSFLRAGLLPRLRRDRENFLVGDIVRPERAALTGDRGLAHAIWHLRSRAGPGGPALGEVKDSCRAANIARITTWLREAQRGAAIRDVVPTVVLPIDQGEELFSVDAGPEAATCLTLLGGLLASDSNGPMPLIAVVTIRTDRYGSLQNAAELAGVHTRQFGDLKPMPLTEYKEVITGPAGRASAAGRRLVLDADVVARLLADATGGADSLPLLALTLSRLYFDYGSTGRLTLAQYEAMGGMARIVQAEIDTLLAADPEERAQQLEALRGAFIPWLATIDPDTDAPSRRVATWPELPQGSHKLIDAMVARRLLVKDEQDGAVVVEVALESLLRQWDSLAGWLRDHAADLKAVAGLDRSAADWERSGRSPEWLIGGVRLAAAEQLADSPVFGARVRQVADFVDASRRRQDAAANAELHAVQAHASALRKRASILRVVLAITLTVALLAVTASVVAFRSYHAAEEKRREALTAQLTSEALAILTGAQPGSELDGITKLLAAQQTSKTFDTGALLNALDAKPRLRRIIDLPGGGLLSGDGERIAATTKTGITMWDTETGQVIGAPFGDPTQHLVALSFDGHFVAVADRDNVIRVWDSAGGHPVGQPMAGSKTSVVLAAVSPDGRRVAACDGSITLRLWDTASGHQVGKNLRDGTLVKGLAFSADARRLVSADDSQIDQVWDATSGVAVGAPLSGPQVTGPFRGTNGIVFSPDVKTIAGSGDTETVGAKSYGTALQLWDTGTGAAIGSSPPGNYGSDVHAVAFSPDGRLVATGGDDKTVRLWDAHTAQPIGAPIVVNAPVNSIAFTRQGNAIVAVCGDTAVISDTDPNTGLLTETNGSKAARLNHVQDRDVPYGLSIGRNLQYGLSIDSGLVAILDDQTARRFDIDNGVPVGQPVTSSTLRGLSVFDVSHDGRWLATIDFQNAVHVVDVLSGQTVGELIRDPRGVTDVAFSPDGQTLAVAGGDTVAMWDWRQHRQIGDPMNHQHIVDSVLFSQDGRRLISKSWYMVRVWDTTTHAAIGKPIEAPPPMSEAIDSTFHTMAASPDGRRIATALNNTLQQWDADTGDTVGPAIRGPFLAVDDLAYSPDGRYLAGLPWGQTLRFWDSATGRQIGEPIGTTAIGWASRVYFSHDGRKVFVMAIPAHADSTNFYGGGIWQLPAPAAWKDALCNKLAANPSPKRWSDWIPPDIPYTKPCQDRPAPPDG